jgi:FkbM family methyltransferase
MPQAVTDLQTFFNEICERLRLLEDQTRATRKDVAALHAENLLRKQNREPTMPIEFTSQYCEDAFVWDLLGRPTTGFFIEAGAFDGYRFSITYALEAMGWKGLLVEANPGPANQCAQRRQRSNVVNAALGRKDCEPTTTFWVVQDKYGGMLSYSKATPENLDGLRENPKTLISVPQVSLDSLLASHHGEIDLLTLDLEGAELDALNGFDINKYRPRIMMLEDNSLGQNRSIYAAMQPYPYVPIGRFALSAIFVRNDQTDVMERRKWILQR